MNKNNYNEFNEYNLNEIINSESDSDTNAWALLIMFISKKLWCTIILLLMAWGWDIRLWQTIVLTILAVVNLLLPNTRDNETMGYVRVATTVIAILVTILLF